jgi:hypothetical protein
MLPPPKPKLKPRTADYVQFFTTDGLRREWRAMSGDADAQATLRDSVGNLAPARGEWLKSYRGIMTDEEGTSDMSNIFGTVVYARRHGAYPDKLAA